MAPTGRAASVSSGPSSEGGSSVASRESLGILGRDSGDVGDADLLRGASNSKKETFFKLLFYIYTDRYLPTDWRYVGLAVLLQWVQLLLLFFGPGFDWNIDWHGNSFWRFYTRLQLQNAITQRSYKTYEITLFGGTALLLLVLAIVGWLHIVLRTKTHFRWQWPSHLLRMVVCIVFTTLQTSYLLLFTVAVDCGKKSGGFKNHYFPDKGCFAMPHAAFFGLSVVMMLVFQALSMLFALIECGATESLSRNFLSLSNGTHFVLRRVIKFVLPLVPVALRTVPRWEGWALLLLSTWFLFITVRRAPYHRTYLNVGEAALYSICWWASGLALIGIYYPQYWPALTTAFLAGALPMALAVGCLTWWRLRRMWRVAMLFERWTPQLPRREVHKFRDPEEVEVVARVAHKLMKTETLDWVPIPLWVACAGNALRAGLAQFPESAFLNIQLGTFEAVLRQEASGGLTYLQKARKCSGITLPERFQCFVREQEKLAKKTKESDASAIMDSTSWSEYQANYRAVIRSHKGAITAIKSFWQLLLHSDVSMTSLQRHFLRIEKARGLAERSYRTVMERYPNNPRILRAYSRFLQQIKNDPHGSARYGASAGRIEMRQNEARSELVYSQIMDRQFKDPVAEKMMAMVDETSDAVCIINLEGLVQFVNEPFLRLFGYRKGELEGSNVARIMPNPFSAQHDSYLRNYATSRVPKILDTAREVVALHKHRFVFGVTLCVTPITLGGTECFMGVIQPMPDDPRVATAYCVSSGTMVCVSRGFGNVLGWAAEDVIGKPFGSLSSTADQAASIVTQVMGSAMGEVQDYGELMIQTRYGEEVRVSVKGSRAGTDAVRAAKLQMTYSDRYSGLLVVSPVSSRIIYANQTIGELLGYTTEALIKMKLHELMPEPYAQLHQRYIKGRDLSRCPGLKCRSGRVVEFRSKSGKLVPCLMELTERATDNGNVFSVKVAPVASKEEAEYNRVSLSVNEKGEIVAPPQGNVSILGLQPDEVSGRPLSDFIDLYRRDKRDLAEVHAELLAKVRSKEVASFRVAAAIRGRRSVPCVLVVQLPPDEDAKEGVSLATMHLYRADYLEGIVELDSNCKIKKASEELGLIFGLTMSELVGEPIQKVLPHVCPKGGKSAELLVARGQRGGAKRNIGAVVTSEAVHPDGRPLHISLQASESTERPGRYMARIIVPRPISAVTVLTDQPAAGTAGAAGTAASRWAAAGAAAAGGILQPGLYSAAMAGPPGADSSGAAPPPGCPFHRALSGGSSLLQRLGVGGSRPASSGAAPEAPAQRQGGAGGGACPINPDTAGVLASLSFPATSQFADPAVASAAAAEIAGSRPGTQSGSMPPPACPFHRPTTGASQGAAGTAPQGATEAAEADPGSAGPSERSMGVSSEGEAGEAKAELEAAGSDGAQQEGGDEEEVDEEELAAKRKMVESWLISQGAGAAGGGSGADTIAAAGGAPAHAHGRSGGAAGELLAGSPAKAALVPLPDVALALEDEPGKAERKGGSMADDSSQPDSEATSAMDSGLSGAEEEGDVDFSRLKRFKKAYKVLNGMRARQAINNLQARLKYLLGALVIAHVACFVVSFILINSSLSYISQIDYAGQAARISMSALTDVRNIQYAGVEMARFGHVMLFPEQNVSVKAMMSKIDQFESFQETLYFGKGNAAQQTREYYQKLINVTEFMDLGYGVGELSTEMTLWEASQHAINAFRAVAELPESYLYNMTLFPEWRYLIQNLPELISVQLIYATDLQTRLAVARLHDVINATWGLLGGEGLFVPLVIAYLFWLLRAVALERFSLFAVFLYLPRPAVMAQARAQIEADDLENDSDDDDDAEVMGTAASNAVNMQLSARTLAARAAQDKLAISRKRVWWMLSPLALWFAVVLIVWLLQYYWLSTAEERVMALNASERIYVYNARSRFFANELAVQGNDIDTDNDVTLNLRHQLDLAGQRIKFYGDTVLYGSYNPYRPLENDLHNLAHMSFMSTLFSNPARAKLLFEQHVCHRTAADPPCFTSSSYEYQTINMGLDTYINTLMEKARALAAEDMSVIQVDHPIMRYIVEATRYDGVEMLMIANRIFMQIRQATKYDGVRMLRLSNDLFMKISNFTDTKALQAAALAVVIVGCLAYLYLIAKPFFAATQAEPRKVAELLSFIPAVDVGALMDSAAGRTGVGALARTSSRSSDTEATD